MVLMDMGTGSVEYSAGEEGWRVWGGRWGVASLEGNCAPEHETVGPVLRSMGLEVSPTGMAE
jgi:hypothetical protein